MPLDNFSMAIPTQLVLSPAIIHVTHKTFMAAPCYSGDMFLLSRISQHMTPVAAGLFILELSGVYNKQAQLVLLQKPFYYFHTFSRNSYHWNVSSASVRTHTPRTNKTIKEDIHSYMHLYSSSPLASLSCFLSRDHTGRDRTNICLLLISRCFRFSKTLEWIS